MLRRSLRILRTSLTILSLVLLFAILALWPRSKGTSDELRYGTIDQSRQYGPYSGHFLISNDGGLMYRRFENRGFVDKGAIPREPILWFREPAVPIPQGFYFKSDDSPRAFFRYTLRVPYWFLAILFAIAPTLKLRAILRARKQTRGFEVSLTADERR